MNTPKATDGTPLSPPTCSASYFHGNAEYRIRDGVEEARNHLNPDWVAVGPANKNSDKPLELGDKIMNGDYFICDGNRFPATDTDSGIMSKSHYPHFRPNSADQQQK